MLGNNVNMNWACFLIHNFMYFYLWDYIKNGKEKFELGRGYVVAKRVKIMTLVAFSICLLHIGKNNAVVIPVLVNHDYQTFSGKVLEIEEEREYKNSGLYYYDVVLEVEDEKEYIEEMFSPKLDINDRIEYYVSIENQTEPVVKINNKNVTERYEVKWPLSRPDTEAIIAKPLFSIYVIAFVVCHSYMINRKYKFYKFRREQNIRFILGKDKERTGFKLWFCGSVLFVVVGIIALANIADNRILGRIMEISVYLYAVGYLIVVLSQNREVILINGKMCVKYDHGWKKDYAISEIISMKAIKSKTYKVIFEDEREIKLTIHNEKQRELLNNMEKGERICTN